MLRKAKIAVFLALITSSMVLLSISCMHEIEIYRAASFEFQILEITVFYNATSGSFRRIDVQAALTNPAQIVSLEFRSVQTRGSLNGESLRYAWGSKGPMGTLVQPGETLEFQWNHGVYEGDYVILQEAMDNNRWNWFFELEVYTVIGFIGQNSVHHDQPFNDVTLIIV